MFIRLVGGAYAGEVRVFPFAVGSMLITTGMGVKVDPSAEAAVELVAAGPALRAQPSQAEPKKDSARPSKVGGVTKGRVSRVALGKKSGA